MDFSKLKKLTIGGVELVKLFVNGIQVWKSGYKNWVTFSTTEDGKTIYNGGLGYKNGYRIRSGGAEASFGDAACTGFIPVKGGDVVRISGWDFSHTQAANAINVSGSAFANIGQFTTQPASYGIFAENYSAYSYNSVVEETPGIWKWTVPPAASGVAYIRVTGWSVGILGSDMIVTINEEIA